MEIYHTKPYQIHDITQNDKFSTDFILEHNSLTSMKAYRDDNIERLIENKA